VSPFSRLRAKNTEQLPPLSTEGLNTQEWQSREKTSSRRTNFAIDVQRSTAHVTDVTEALAAVAARGRRVTFFTSVPAYCTRPPNLPRFGSLSSHAVRQRKIEIDESTRNIASIRCGPVELVRESSGRGRFGEHSRRSSAERILMLCRVRARREIFQSSIRPRDRSSQFLGRLTHRSPSMPASGAEMGNRTTSTSSNFMSTGVDFNPRSRSTTTFHAMTTGRSDYVPVWDEWIPANR
jgi:hypothetical protein